MQSFFESFVLQFLLMFTHLIHSNLVSTADLSKSLRKNIDLYCCSHMSIKKCTFFTRGSIWCLLWIDPACIVSEKPLLHLVLMVSQNVFICSVSILSATAIPTALVNGRQTGCPEDLVCISINVVTYGVRINGLCGQLSSAWAQPACKNSTYSLCSALPGTWGTHSSFGRWVIFFLKAML